LRVKGIRAIGPSPWFTSPGIFRRRATAGVLSPPRPGPDRALGLFSFTGPGRHFQPETVADKGEVRLGNRPDNHWFAPRTNNLGGCASTLPALDPDGWILTLPALDPDGWILTFPEAGKSQGSPLE